MNPTTMEVKEEHATLLGIRLFKCPRNDDNDNGNYDLFLLNVLTTVPQGRPKTLLEYFDNQCAYHYTVMKDFSIRWDHDNLIEKRVVHDKIANLNIFQSHTDLELSHDIHNYIRSLFRHDNNSFCTNLVFVWVIDIHRYEFTEEYLGDTNTDCTSTDSKIDGNAIFDLYPNGADTYIPYQTGEADVYNPFTDINSILEYVRRSRQDLSLKMEEVGPLIEIQVLVLDVASTEDGYRHVVAENGVEGSCSICWEAFEGEVVAQNSIYKWLPEKHSWSLVRLKCGHVFHHRCIFDWLPEHPTCPYCRSTTLTFF